MDEAILAKLKISSWELDINSLILSFFTAAGQETIPFLEWQERIAIQDRDLVVNLILETIDEKRTLFDCQFHLQGKDRKVGSYRMRGFPFRVNGGQRFSKLIGVYEDFSTYETKISELQRKLAHAEQKNREKKDFFASIVHELRTPMSGVIGLADIVLESNTLDEDNRTLVRSIHQCGVSLLSLVNDTLDLSKLEARKLSLVPIEFSLNHLLQDIEILFSAKFKEKKQTFVAVIAPEVPDRLFTDPNRLQQVLVNLIGNALKFTPESGGICVQVELTSKSENIVSLKFSVIDSGIGIESESQTAIFDEYSQASDETAVQYGGTGLGLSVARELVSLFNGSLKVQSEPGRGTVFYFTLQADLPKVLSISHVVSVSKKEDRIPLVSFKILLAEDNLVNQKVASRMLEKAGHQVKIVGNGQQVLDIRDKEDFDLILMDIQMPIMSGDRATQLIRESEKDHGAKPIPIIALTAHALTGDREKYLALGMNDYVTKPINKDLLFQAMADCLKECKTATNK